MFTPQKSPFSWFFNSWWVLVFCALATAIYVPAMKGRKAALSSLHSRLLEMEREKWAALQEKEDLTLRIASQSDPAWIEMVLLREMGVVPEGFLKVHFKK